MPSGKIIKMALCEASPQAAMSSAEKVRSWMASTSGVQKLYPHQDEPDGESIHFELTHHPLFIEDQASTPRSMSRATQQKVFIPRKTNSEEVSCASVFKKYLPTHASAGSKLVPGFLRTVRRRQSISLLRKHAFRWATISAKKFVMIRTDGCNMVPWTDISEYFFPLCDDPSCEIVLLALKYALGYPKMIRHIHPCSQREQLRFGDLFKVVSFGTILVDIDAVLANKGVLWNLVEEMHSSCNPGLAISKCSYRNPEKKVFQPHQMSPGSDPVVTLSQHARANSPWDGVMDFQNDEQTVYIEDSKTPDDHKIKFEKDSNSNIVEFLGEQANQMWRTLSKENPRDARTTKSWNDVTPSKGTSKSTFSSTTVQNDSGQQPTEQRPFSAVVQKMSQEISSQEDGLFYCSPSSSIQIIPLQQPMQPSGQVVALKVNNTRLLPVIIPGDDPCRVGQDLNKWLVPVYLLQSMCLNAHVTGKLVAVYRDFIVGRTCKTPGGKGYARLCTRQEGRDLTRWLFYMSEKASLIPTWTIVTSRCLLMQWRDFLQHLPSDTVQTFEIDLSMSVLKMGRRNDHGPIDSNDNVSSIDKAKFGKVLGETCRLVKKGNKGEESKNNDQTWAKPPCSVPFESDQLLQNTNGCEADPELWYPSADWTAQLLEEPQLPFTELKDCAEGSSDNDPLATTRPSATTTMEARSPGDEYPVSKCQCQDKDRTGSGTGPRSKLPCIVGHRCQIQSDKEPCGVVVVEEPMKQCGSDSPHAGLSQGRMIGVKPKQQNKGGRYSCKSPVTNETGIWTGDGRWTGTYQPYPDRPSFAGAEAIPHEGKLVDQKRPRRYIKYSATYAGRLKEQVTKANEKMSSASFKYSGGGQRTMNKISTELINKKSYEKYVHKRNQVEEDRSDTVSSKQETVMQPGDEVDSKAPMGTRASSEQINPLHQGTHNHSDKAENTEKTTEANGSEVTTLRPRNPSMKERQQLGEQSEVPLRKNHFQGLTLWAEEDEVPELDTYFKPFKANSQPLKQCLRTKDKKPPSKTVSWHIPGVYPREERTENTKTADQNCSKTKPKRSILKCKEETMTKTAAKPASPKPAENKPRQPEPGGYFKPKAKCSDAGFDKPCISTSKDEPKPRQSEVKVVQVKVEPPAAGISGSSTANVEPSKSENVTLQINTKDSKDLTNSANESTSVSPVRAASKVVAERAVKAESLIFSSAQKVENLVRIYTGSPNKQQELISKRVSLGRKNVQSDSKIPQLRRTRASSGKIESGEGNKVTTGTKSSDQVTTKWKRHPRRAKRKTKTVTKSCCCDTVLTAWEVKNEPGSGSDFEQEEDKKFLHGHLHGESTFKVPVDRTEVIKSCSIVQQQQKLLEAIQKKTKATPKSTSLTRDFDRQSATQHSLAAASCSPEVSLKQEPLDVSAKTCSTPEVEKANVSKSEQNPWSFEKKDLKPLVNLEPKVQYSFQPQFDPGQTVSNRGLAMYEDLVLPYVAMNGYKYVTLVDATRVFSQCNPNCRIARSVLRSHRALHRTMCSWEQVYGFELTQPNKKPPVRTGDMLVRFDTLILRLPLLENELKLRHQNSKATGSQKCGYSTPS